IVPAPCGGAHCKETTIMKRLTLPLVLLLVLVLAACTAPQPQVVEVTRVVTETVQIEGEAVEVTRVVTEEVEVTRVVETEAEAPVDTGTTEYERSETLYTSGTQWGPPSSWNPMNLGNYATGTLGLC